MHYDKHYTPANISIVGVGGMTLSEIVALLSESPFAINKDGAKTPLPTPVATVALPLETRYVFEISKHMTTEVPVEVGGYQSLAKIPGSINARAIRVLQDMFNEVVNEEVGNAAHGPTLSAVHGRIFEAFMNSQLTAIHLLLPRLMKSKKSSKFVLLRWGIVKIYLSKQNVIFLLVIL
ncbi:MAG: hypothetical protein HZB09_00460 [Candidatus Yonathbacteria bacterium]|nr:hypothetical protein [Candidatus Yonathbacteria bacterium]